MLSVCWASAPGRAEAKKEDQKFRANDPGSSKNDAESWRSSCISFSLVRRTNSITTSFPSHDGNLTPDSHPMTNHQLLPYPIGYHGYSVNLTPLLCPFFITTAS